MKNKRVIHNGNKPFVRAIGVTTGLVQSLRKPLRFTGLKRSGTGCLGSEERAREFFDDYLDHHRRGGGRGVNLHVHPVEPIQAAAR